jgi:hypothetical protein
VTYSPLGDREPEGSTKVKAAPLPQDGNLWIRAIISLTSDLTPQCEIMVSRASTFDDVLTQDGYPGLGLTLDIKTHQIIERCPSMSDGVKQALSLCEYMNWDPMEDFKAVVSSYDHLFWQDRENPWTFFPEPVLPPDWDRRLETKTKQNSKARKSIFVNEITGEVSTTPPTSSSESLSRVSCTRCIDSKLRVSLLTLNKTDAKSLMKKFSSKASKIFGARK